MADAPVYYDGSNEPTLAPQFEWSANTVPQYLNRVQRSSEGAA